LASALERLVRGCSEQGSYDGAIPHARRWLALDPLHEPAQRQLMELYAQSGQWAAAVRQYEECVRVLDEELGIPPSEETTALFELVKTKRVPPQPSPVANKAPPLVFMPDGQRLVSVHKVSLLTRNRLNFER